MHYRPRPRCGLVDCVGGSQSARLPRGLGRGLLLLDPPDALVTIDPSMDKLAVRPLLLLGPVWLAIGMMRGSQRSSSAAVGPAAILIVGMLRYVALRPGLRAIRMACAVSCHLGSPVRPTPACQILARRPRKSSWPIHP